MNIESILTDEALKRELKERGEELLGKAARGDSEMGPFVESLAQAPGVESQLMPDIAETLARAESHNSELDGAGMTEAIIMRFGRPSLLIRDGTFEVPQSDTWRARLDPFRDVIDGAIASAGRIELKGHPRFLWVGTGWLIDEQTIITNRHVAQVFADEMSQFRKLLPGLDVSIDFYEEHQRSRQLVAAVTDIVHVESNSGVDMALLRLDKKAVAKLKLVPVAVADGIRDGATIGAIGYPAHDPRNDDADMARIFRDVYDKKRLAPGHVKPVRTPARTFAHDCTTLGGSSGSVLIDVESGCAVGLHFGGREGDKNLAVEVSAIRDVAAKNRVSVRGCEVGGGSGGRAGYTETESPASLDDREGYNPQFLGGGKTVEVPMPALNALQMRQAAKLEDDSIELKYTHFSLVMNAERRLAFFTAVNIDGTDLWHKKRKGDPWQTDPRIPEDAQVDNALYTRNDFDRGHLVRRLDPVWGDKSAAKVAEKDTFYYTNAAPQHKDLNRKIWLNLEEHVLGKAEDRDARISVFAGPIFGSSDPRSKRSGLEEIGIPLGFWKVIASIGRTRRGRMELHSQAFVMWQWDMFGEADLELIFGDRFETYQLAVSDLERLTGLDFSERVRDADTYEKPPEAETGIESVAGGRPGPRVRLEAIQSPDQIIA
ncbi:DNA/RNA non-specific endonuclease [Oricola sp.]|uniref:DNA/RNA non-specific endonuclease n=1 Tax=Oricola sp. TaxID=1979950 RepID=UPI003BA84DA0